MCHQPVIYRRGNPGDRSLARIQALRVAYSGHNRCRADSNPMGKIRMGSLNREMLQSRSDHALTRLRKPYKILKKNS